MTAKTANNVWRVRPAGSRGAGRPVSWSRLSQGIQAEEVGELDEVQQPGQTAWRPAGEHPRTAELVPAGRRPVRRGPDDAESDLTPMIDVTFQLVIFFMIAATYTIQKTLDLPPPQPDPEAAATVTMEELEQDNILVRIAGDGTITVQDQPVPPAQLVRTLRQAMSQKRRAELVLDVDDQAIHDTVVQVLDAAGAAHIEKVLFVSRMAPAGGAGTGSE